MAIHTPDENASMCSYCHCRHRGACRPVGWRKELELSAADNMLSMSEQIGASQAISLKRIADALERIAPADGAGIADDIRRAIQSGISEGANEAIYYWKQNR